MAALERRTTSICPVCGYRRVFCEVFEVFEVFDVSNLTPARRKTKGISKVYGYTNLRAAPSAKLGPQFSVSIYPGLKQLREASGLSLGYGIQPIARPVLSLRLQGLRASSARWRLGRRRESSNAATKMLMRRITVKMSITLRRRGEDVGGIANRHPIFLCQGCAHSSKLPPLRYEIMLTKPMIARSSSYVLLRFFPPPNPHRDFLPFISVLMGGLNTKRAVRSPRYVETPSLMPGPACPQVVISPSSQSPRLKVGG